MTGFGSGQIKLGLLVVVSKILSSQVGLDRNRLYWDGLCLLGCILIGWIEERWSGSGCVGLSQVMLCHVRVGFVSLDRVGFSLVKIQVMSDKVKLKDLPTMRTGYFINKPPHE